MYSIHPCLFSDELRASIYQNKCWNWKTFLLNESHKIQNIFWKLCKSNSSFKTGFERFNLTKYNFLWILWFPPKAEKDMANHNKSIKDNFKQCKFWNSIWNSPKFKQCLMRVLGFQTNAWHVYCSQFLLWRRLNCVQTITNFMYLCFIAVGKGFFGQSENQK